MQGPARRQPVCLLCPALPNLPITSLLITSVLLFKWSSSATINIIHFSHMKTYMFQILVVVLNKYRLTTKYRKLHLKNRSFFGSKEKQSFQGTLNTDEQGETSKLLQWFVAHSYLLDDLCDTGFLSLYST